MQSVNKDLTYPKIQITAERKERLAFKVSRKGRGRYSGSSNHNRLRLISVKLIERSLKITWEGF